MEKKRIYLSSPTMYGDEMKYIQEAFDTNWIAPAGANIKCFEQEISDYLSDESGQLYATALSSGTAALHLALINEGVGQGDIVFCQDLTFAAACNAIVYQGAVPVLVDSEPDSWNMNPVALQRAFELYPKVKAVIVVDLYGVPAKWQEITDICAEHNVPIIEDAAEALGATYRGRYAGTFGRQAAISFNGNKIITTSGGGMLVSKEKELAAKAAFFATQAKEPERHYEHKEIGYNYRMSNVLAGIGRGQLRHLNEQLSAKKAIYKKYREAFSDISEIQMNPVPDGCEPNYWLSCMTLKKGCPVKPMDIIVALEQENIESRPIWKPMHLQPVFRKYPFVTATDSRDGLEVTGTELPSVSEDVFERGLCLPSDVKNTAEDIERIVSIVKRVMER